MTDKTRNKLTESQEDYLKKIFELGEVMPHVTTQALADHLNVKPASVTGMLRKLSELSLVDYEKYHGVELTAAGEKIAVQILRHHRLIEMYLSEVLGYTWDEIHEEAERLEHHISEKFEARIAEKLGHPTHDPHGDPIPSADLKFPGSAGYGFPAGFTGWCLRHHLSGSLSGCRFSQRADPTWSDAWQKTECYPPRARWCADCAGC